MLPVPKGWSQVPDPNVPDAFAVIADRVGGNGLYSSNAQVVVYKLVGDFDPKEAISHGFIDSQQLPAWRATDGSLADFGGMPSSVIEGTYRENNMTLNTSRRHVIATAGPDKYLVSLAVTTSVDQVVAAADATDAIVNGFKVSLPDATGPRRRRSRHRACPSSSRPGAQRHSRSCWASRDRRRPPGEAWRPGDGPIQRAQAGSYCVAHAHRRGALPVRRRRDRPRSVVWLLTRPRSGDFVRQVLRAVAPTQLAAAVMLAASRSGGAVVDSPRPACCRDRVRRRRDRNGRGGLLAERRSSCAAQGGAPPSACGGASLGCGRGACATCTLSCN